MESIIIAIIAGVIIGIILKFIVETREKKGTVKNDSSVEFNETRSTVAVPHEIKVKIFELIAKNQKIHAIKLLREETSMGLAEAKEYIDALEEEKIIPIVSSSDSLKKEEPMIEMTNLAAEIKALLKQGKKIVAIKKVHESTNLGLKEAKDYVEMLEQQ